MKDLRNNKCKFFSYQGSYWKEQELRKKLEEGYAVRQGILEIDDDGVTLTKKGILFCRLYYDWHLPASIAMFICNCRR